jgi:hypothetical protein
MSQANADSAQLQNCIERLRHGGAGQDLIRHACARLQRLARKMLRGFPSVKRWEDTDDVFQNAVVRLWLIVLSVVGPIILVLSVRIVTLTLTVSGTA